MADDEKPKRKATPATRKGNGPGIGGPAKGWGQSGPGPRRNMPEGRAAAIAAKDERAAALTAHLERLAFEAENESVRFQATVAALNRIEGTPISRSMKVDGDDLSKLSDAELAARREALERAEAEARGRNASPVGAGEPARLVN